MSSDASPRAAAGSPPDTPALRARFVIPFAVAYFGLWVATLTPVVLTLQVRVDELAPETRGGSLSLVLGIGAVFGLLANPVAGRLSDRCTSRWGMRRPWLLIGVLVTVAGSAVVAFAGSIPILAVGWSITQIGINTALSVMLAWLPDHVPTRARGRVSGMLGVAQAVAAIAAASLGGGLLQVSSAAAVLVPGLVMLLAVGLACLVIKDRVADPAERQPLGLGQLARSFVFNPRRYPDFGWAWLSRFAIFMAIASVLNYQLYYLTAQLGLTTERATALIPAGVAVQTVIVVIGSAVFGPLSDRLGRRKVFVVASAFVAAAGLLILAFATSLPLYFVAMALVGLGQGTYFAVDLALVADVLPNRETDAAKDLGVFNVANLLPQSLAPALAPVFLGIGFGSLSETPGNNYVALFLAGTVFSAISAVTILPIRKVR
ncbi:MFS transporter [Amycolatopsis sp. NPDC098790]|uniref:MFS transporter n=1 Tax=Amycolatopsis sp. NPDC098790 TaxID=3363939 RepID=UPI0038164987